MSAIAFPHEVTLTTTAGKVDVTVDLPDRPRDGARLSFQYCRSKAALIECGAISADLMAPQRRGRRRVDEDGDCYSRQHYKHHTIVDRYKRLDSLTLPNLPGYLPGMIPAAQELIAAGQAREEQREREQAERHNLKRAEPEDYRQRVARHAEVGMIIQFMLRTHASNSTDGLAEGYRMREDDVLAILDCAYKAQADLTRLINAMRFDRVRPLRLVVNNA
ncbi:MAG: hypothetical protein AB7P31_13645 [Steroidobacteraceae bacterium]